MPGKCRNCAFWFRGKKVTYGPESVLWDGSPHPKAGLTVTERSWVGLHKGECQNKTGPLMDHLTRRDFGCSLWQLNLVGDGFEYVTIIMHGQETMAQARAKEKEQPDFGVAPIGIVYTREGVGIVQYPQPKESFRLEGKTFDLVQKLHAAARGTKNVVS